MGRACDEVGELVGYEVEDGASAELNEICSKLGVSVSKLYFSYIENNYSDIHLSKGMKLHVRNLLWLAGWL